ncbi:2-dehydro-3-deoxygalactonokinase [Arthrobacter sp. AL12]|uniref:2-dehydro-3-deoxygalactonokinase n=1 Tax=Arthrobacter sp. AL12 TaxID=3042241 RepID=UPI00249A2546|nr:2-dehydro-3-deoxygalactonokinase [Arthrobacter sp. AL12]MDI3213623.1 2-dehydro-3-deoxygalactonokinase [Arthrobacter sp. AL12]
MTKQSGARLIALDWGTSSCRAFLLGNDGIVLSERRGNSGVMDVSTAADLDGLAYEEAFEEVFEALCGDWLTDLPALPVIACGMVGSNRGWVQTPYRLLPADLTGDGIALTAVPTRRGATVHIISGLMDDSKLPDIIRGEETQVLGAIVGEQASGSADLEHERVVLLPGTHSKWVRIKGSTVTSFTTCMTGELFSLLTTKSTLAQPSARLEEADWDAFVLGLDVAGAPPGNGGILTTAFSARTLVMTGRLRPNQVEDYLSGLLIGSEIADIKASWLADITVQILLCGEPDLNQRYRMALERFGLSVTHETTTSAVIGMWRTAVSASLLSDAGSPASPTFV